MPHAPFIRRVILRNYKSIGYCDVRLQPLTYLVGHNGAGKSNFMDALHFVKDAVSNSLEYAFNERAGISEVRRYSNGRPNNFSIRIDFNLPDSRPGHYVFSIGALTNGGYEVQREECVISGIGKGPYFRIEKGKLRKSSEKTFPAIVSDRLALVAVSGIPAFRPVFDALKAMGFYNLNPKLMRELQKPPSVTIDVRSSENRS
ncbi:AAA family ATPase [Castellaniella defragrans]|uniref:AAA family ATPase n=1 Tax=Castellaniella defragrans TaxID=75697 RepID=UPI002AFF8D09|nr:AAA family ATPase [Castellaniella defragrans]